MTEQPERVWRALPWNSDHAKHGLASWPMEEQAGEGSTEYVRADKVQALVEAAYRAGWDASGEGWNGEYPGNAHEGDMWVSARAAALAAFTDGGTQG